MSLQSRRRFLRAAVLLAAGSLAGCPSLGATGTGTAADSTETPTTTPAATSAEPETPTPTASPSPTSTDTATDDPTATPEPRVGGGPGPLPDAAWPLPDRGASNAAYNPGGVAFEGAPSVDWSATPMLPSAVEEYDAEFLQPVVADGRVYAVNAVVPGPMQPRPDRQFLRAFDRTTGEGSWTYEVVDADGVAPPDASAFGDGVVLFATGPTLHAVDAATGTAGWTRTLADDVAVVTHAGFRTYAVVSGTLHAVDGNGETAWTTAIDRDVRARPALGSDSLYLGDSAGRLHALDPATGERAWTEPVAREGRDDASLDRVVTFANGLVARGGDTLYGVSDDGSQVWRATGEYASVTADGTSLYCTTDLGRVHAVDAATGETRWETEYGDELNSRYGRPVVAGDLLYLPVEDRLVAARTDDGAVLWRAEFDLESLALGSDTLYGVGSGPDDADGLLALR